MTCAKTKVFCTITDVYGRQAIGENRCENPQAICPRAPGEDYEKCTTICQQVGHAEIDAINVAKERNLVIDGSHAVILNHSYACRHCQEALYAAGVEWIGVRHE